VSKVGTSDLIFLAMVAVCGSMGSQQIEQTIRFSEILTSFGDEAKKVLK